MPHKPTMAKRCYNFSAGPSCLPLAVLEKAGREITSYGDSGMSVMEMSHRGKAFTRIFEECKGTFRQLIGLDDSYELLFLPGGATFQFAAVPFNFCGKLPTTNEFANYVISGGWSAKAADEAHKCGPVKTWDLKRDGKYSTLPSDLDWSGLCATNSKYFHYCANETVMGIEFSSTPKASSTDIPTPLVSDMSSSFLSRPIDFKSHGLIYAGVQKNVAPSSMAVVLASKEFLATADPHPSCPTLFSYAIQAKNDSLYNTPPVWSIYIAGEVAKWIKQQGGLAAMQDAAAARSNMLYDCIDSSDDYYTNPVEKHARSRMNVPFRVGRGSQALETKFVREAAEIGLVELKGHRSVGGCRASMYNAMPLEGVESLIAFMKSFRTENPG